MLLIVCKKITRKRNVARLLIVSASLSLLSACSWFGDEVPDLDARVLAPLEVPPDLVSPTGDPRLARLVLPTLSPGPTSSLSLMQQPVDCQCNEMPRIGERVLPPGKGVQRMREGQRRWLVAEAEPEQVWPLVRTFLTIRGYRVQRDEPAIGLLETDWKPVFVDESADTDAEQIEGPAQWRESLRIRIEPAERAGYTDIFLSQRSSQRVAVVEETTRWELRPSDEDRAAVMLSRLANYLTAEDVSEAVPLQPLNAYIDVDSNDHTVIIAEAEFENVWRRTNLALEALGFTIEDLDRASRIFHIYNELPSGLSEIELNRGRKKSATVREEYWIHVQEVGELIHISVRNKDENVDESEVARHVLTLLLGRLN